MHVCEGKLTCAVTYVWRSLRKTTGVSAHLSPCLSHYPVARPCIYNARWSASFWGFSASHLIVGLLNYGHWVLSLDLCVLCGSELWSSCLHGLCFIHYAIEN